MTRIILLERLRDFTKAATENLLLPVSPPNGVEWMDEDGNPQTPEYRAPEVFLTGLPDIHSYTSKAPYIMHQLITCRDVHIPGSQATSSAVVRSVFCVYDENGAEGGMALLEFMERLRIALEKTRVIGKQFRLDLEAGVDTLVYTDSEETAPYYLGEMITRWWMPTVKEEVDIYGRKHH